MKYVMSIYESVVPEKLQFFFALSRTHHGVLDMMAPFLAALLYLGRFPSPGVAVVGMITVVAGYTAVYAFNDIAGFRDDKNNISVVSEKGVDLDSILIRHPLAHGLISFKEALLWGGGWSLIAVAGACYLNPVCLLIFAAGVLFEIVYCFLLKVTYLRIFISCLVKAAGPVAAVFAVDPFPDPLFTTVLFIFFVFWEAGGQNLPNDYCDIDEDRRINAKTLPLIFGRKVACVLITGLLVSAFLFMALLFMVSPTALGLFLWPVFAAGSFLLLVLPSLTLLNTRKNEAAMQLFNKASYYPIFVLSLILVNLFI